MDKKEERRKILLEAVVKIGFPLLSAVLMSAFKAVMGA